MADPSKQQAVIIVPAVSIMDDDGNIVSELSDIPSNQATLAPITVAPNVPDETASDDSAFSSDIASDDVDDLEMFDEIEDDGEVYDSEDECFAWLEAYDILRDLLEADMMYHGELDKSISYDEFRDRFWDEFRSACYQSAEDFKSVCVEDYFEDYHTGMDWPTWRWLIHRFESSYLPGRKPLGCPDREVIDYEKCMPAELKRFVNQRRLQDPFPGGVTLKYFYIKLLEKADRMFSFDFMGLPVEMRVLIYRCLLTVSDPKDPNARFRKTYPAILQTSKCVYEEAKKVLYEDNFFAAEFRVIVHGEGSLSKSAHVHRTSQTLQCDHQLFIRLPQGIDDYPEFLRRVSHLQIDVKYHTWSGATKTGNGSLPLNHLLYTLASFLMDGHQLKSLRLKVDISDRVEQSEFPIIFYPLRRLRNIPTVIIQGNVPVYIQRKLQEDLTSSEPVFNTLRTWKYLDDRAQKMMQLYSEIAGGCNCIDCMPANGHISGLVEDMALVEHAKSHGCLGSEHEETFLSRLALVKKALQQVDLSKLRELLDDAVKQETMMKDYEDVTDDGRLEEAMEIRKRQRFDVGLKYKADDEDWEDVPNLEEEMSG